MRSLLVLSLTVCAFAAEASFDLMYLPDVQTNRVHRFDPVNRLYLGSFSTSTSRFIAAHNNSPYVVAGSSTILAIYQGSTGEFVNAANTFGDTVTMTPSGNVLAFSGASSFRELTLPNATTVVSSSLSGLPDARGIVAIGTNRFAVGRDTGGNLVLNSYSSSGATLFSSVQVAASATVAGDVATTGMGVSTASNGTVQVWFTWRTNTGAVTLGRYNISGSTATISDTINLTGFSTADSEATQSVMGGHGGSCFIVGPDATTPSLTRIIHMGAFGSGSTQISNYTTNSFSVPATAPWSGANVVAPEPGSLAALALGLVALMRRRTRAGRD
jgi:hypothetical protein